MSAWVMCKQFVKNSLKSPSSADFGGVFSDFQSPAEHVTRLDGGARYRCTGWVDAQNDFGAMKRANFIVTVEYVGNDNWRAISGPLLLER